MKELTNDKHKKLYKLVQPFKGEVYGIVEMKKKYKSFCFDFNYINEAFRIGKKKKLFGNILRIGFYEHPTHKKAMIMIPHDGKNKQQIAIAGRDD